MRRQYGISKMPEIINLQHLLPELIKTPGSVEEEEKRGREKGRCCSEGLEERREDKRCLSPPNELGQAQLTGGWSFLFFDLKPT
jgi:hypothetical protein